MKIVIFFFQIISTNNLYQQIVAKLKDPEFEPTFMKVCNNLNNLNCDGLFALLKTKFSPTNSTKSASKSGRC